MELIQGLGCPIQALSADDVVPTDVTTKTQFSTGSWDTTTILKIQVVGKKGQKGKSKCKKPGLRVCGSSRIFLRRKPMAVLVSRCLPRHAPDISRGMRKAHWSLYKQAVQADPNLSGAWRNLGALLRQRGQFAEARHCTEQALKLR